MLLRVLDEAEARQLPALIAEWIERADALHWIARALQLDLPLLIERPELVLPCLYRRCAWLGDTVFYPKRGPVPLESADLAALIAEWIEARPSRWLRAVRPPRFALDAGVVEEYRTTLKGEIRFSADGSLIGVVGDNTSIGWERATGRKIDPRDRLETPVATWTHEWAGGQISLRSKDRRWDLPVEPVEKVSSCVDLGDDLVLAEAWYEPDPYDDAHAYVLYLVDASAGQIRWRVDGDFRSAIRVGDTIHTLGDAYVERSLATGAELARRSFPYSSSPVFLPNGRMVATRDECVIRVWDLEQLAPNAVACRASGGTISPDGTRVLAGSVLCDARTGAVIADIPFSGRGSWLEGGPPGGAWQLVDNVVVEVLPFHTRIWDSADGRHVAQREHLTAGARDTVCHDPRGRYLAMFKHPDQLSAHDLRTGATLFETTAAVVERKYRDRCFDFSETGDELWWQTEDRRFVVSTATWQRVRVEERAPDPEKTRGDLEIVDGLLVVGDLAAPMDSTSVNVSRDGRVFVGADVRRTTCSSPEALRALLEQRDQLWLFVHGRDRDRVFLVRVLGLRVGARLEQPLDHIEMRIVRVAARDQRMVAALAVDVDVGTALDQELEHLLAGMPRGVGQHRHLERGARVDMDRPCVEQFANRCDVIVDHGARHPSRERLADLVGMDLAGRDVFADEPFFVHHVLPGSQIDRVRR